MQLFWKIDIGDNDGMKSARSIFGRVPRVPAGMVFVPVGSKSVVKPYEIAIQERITLP